MASFVTDLWESIFTPGPTAPLLRAANGSFAALQLVLAGMLYLTGSLHCVVLSVLCAGLWWAVNWFAAELAVAQREQKRRDEEQEEEEEEQRQRRGDEKKTRRKDGAAAADDSSDTEVEAGRARTRGATAKKDQQQQKQQQQQQQQAGAELRQRAAPGSGRTANVSPSGTQSSVSTEDEWEKVSGSEREGKSQEK
ncbi:ER protein pkr1 domain-containing protein [Purpureocillium lavendulum]|uniref:ER protein pkr1 domain-containing protein n=1 Tax=Purpureocillium lavendulum TaxID=1247861 RepID=A0AB34G2F2_9HYPO|nr:ER protein pkr1 domain-containing protein [Purpureocillium lavendulum]